MRRLALFAHYDPDSEIKPYVLYYLERLRADCARIVFISNSPLPEAEIEKLESRADRVLLKENVGLDFGMWQYAVERENLTGYDELVLTNSSIFGPIYPLTPIFQSMSDDACDLWGMTDSLDHRWHLQSYFLVFKKPVLVSECFQAFWKSVLPYRDKTQIILSYEVGIATYLSDHGFRPKAFRPIESWASASLLRRMDRKPWRSNTTLYHPLKLLSLGVPFVKAGVLRENPGNIDLEHLLSAMEKAGYDRRLVYLNGHATSPGSRSYFQKLRRVFAL